MSFSFLLTWLMGGNRLPVNARKVLYCFVESCIFTIILAAFSGVYRLSCVTVSSGGILSGDSVGSRIGLLIVVDFVNAAATRGSCLIRYSTSGTASPPLTLTTSFILSRFVRSLTSLHAFLSWSGSAGSGGVIAIKEEREEERIGGAMGVGAFAVFTSASALFEP